MRDIDATAAKLLGIGVALSLIFFITGLAALLAYGGAPGMRISGSSQLPLAVNTSNYGVARAVSDPSGITLVYAGLFALVLTPISVVSLLIFEFTRSRNGVYAAIATMVLIDMLVAILAVPLMMH